ncbi:MAG TPA: SDR family NAD(P)-dependent oxidoreductase [Solirubrobacteraceae bacterium]|nr:SDR family NAD(P)-dependent oxidoreductase [Solirubrobacteraceae bacterium]
MTVALVTGGSRGIGAATARRLAADGHDVAVGYHADAAAAGEVVEAVRASGRRTEAFPADLARSDAAAGLVAEVEAALGPVDVLVANAGVNQPAEQDVRKVAVDVWDRFMAINLRAPFILSARVIDGMIARGFGRIVLLSSVAAYTGGIIGPHYAASKAGLHGLAHSLSQLAAGKGVTVNVVAPALIATDMMPTDAEALGQLASRIPVGRLGEADEVADLISAVVRNGYLTNQSILIDGGMRPS